MLQQMTGAPTDQMQKMAFLINQILEKTGIKQDDMHGGVGQASSQLRKNNQSKFTNRI